MIEAIERNIDQVFKMTWPMLFISTVLLITIRVAYLKTNNIKIDIFKEFMSLCFILYILCLFQIVTAQDINLLSGNNFIPFKEIRRYSIGSPLFIKNILGNVLMFIPYGFFVCYYTNIKKPMKILILVSIASISIEVTQLLIGRIFDVDDILLNIIGGIVGYFFLMSLDRLFNKIEFIKKHMWVKNAISVVIFVLVMLVVLWRV